MVCLDCFFFRSPINIVKWCRMRSITNVYHGSADIMALFFVESMIKSKKSDIYRAFCRGAKSSWNVSRNLTSMVSCRHMRSQDDHWNWLAFHINMMKPANCGHFTFGTICQSRLDGWETHFVANRFFNGEYVGKLNTPISLAPSIHR